MRETPPANPLLSHMNVEIGCYSCALLDVGQSPIYLQLEQLLQLLFDGRAATKSDGIFYCPWSSVELKPWPSWKVLVWFHMVVRCSQHQSTLSVLDSGGVEEMKQNISAYSSQLPLSWFLGSLIEGSAMGLQFSVISGVCGSVASPWDPGLCAVNDREFKCLVDRKYGVFALVKLVTKNLSDDTGKDNKTPFLGWEFAWAFYLEHSDSERDKFRLQLCPASREGLVVNALKSAQANIHVICSGRKIVVKLVRRQVSIPEPGASIMLLEELPHSKIVKCLLVNLAVQQAIQLTWDPGDEILGLRIDFFLLEYNQCVENLQKYLVSLKELKPWPSWELSLWFLILRIIGNLIQVVIMGPLLQMLSSGSESIFPMEFFSEGGQQWKYEW